MEVFDNNTLGCFKDFVVVIFPLCTTCWKIIDPDGNYIFELIVEENKDNNRLANLQYSIYL
jgi:hypothetical protein